MTYNDGTTRNITPTHDADGKPIPYTDKQTTGSITQTRNYNESGKPTGTKQEDVSDGLDNKRTTTYDENDNPKQFRDDGTKQTTDYNPDKSATITNDPLPNTNHSTSQDYDVDGNPIGPVKVKKDGKPIFDGTPKHPDGTPAAPTDPNANGWDFMGMLNTFAVVGGAGLTAYGIYQIATTPSGQPQFAAVNTTTGDLQNISQKTDPATGTVITSVVCPPGVNPSDFPSGCVSPDESTAYESLTPSGLYQYVPPAHFSFPAQQSFNIPQQGSKLVPGGTSPKPPGGTSPKPPGGTSPKPPGSSSSIIPGVTNTYLYIGSAVGCLCCCLLFLMLMMR